MHIKLPVSLILLLWGIYVYAELKVQDSYRFIWLVISTCPSIHFRRWSVTPISSDRLVRCHVSSPVSPSHISAQLRMQNFIFILILVFFVYYSQLDNVSCLQILCTYCYQFSIWSFSFPAVMASDLSSSALLHLCWEVI